MRQVRSPTSGTYFNQGLERSAMGFSKATARHRIRMLVPLWGARFYEQWFSLAGPSLLAPAIFPTSMSMPNLNSCSCARARIISCLKQIQCCVSYVLKFT